MSLTLQGAAVEPQHLKLPVHQTGVKAAQSINAWKVGAAVYVDVAEVTKLVGGSSAKMGGNAVVQLSKRTLTFLEGSPFVTFDTSTFQLPLPVKKIAKHLCAPVSGMCALVSSFTSDTLEFTSHPIALRISPKPEAQSPEPKAQSLRPKAQSPDSAAPSPERIADTLKPNPLANGQSLKPNPGQPDLDADKSKWAFDLVVIDPGHGGKDPGAIGPGGLREKDVALDVGLRLNKALNEHGVKTVMTRDNDTFIPLSERTSIANRSGGKLFVSLHCNSAKKGSKAGGIETYFMAPTKTERAMNVALRENGVIKYEESRDQYHDLTEENYILLAMAQANFTKESQDLAALVEEQVPQKVGLKERGVDQAGFYVLIGASMPAILFEMAFISNKTEEKKLKSKDFRQQLADEIAASVVNFLQARK